MADETYSSITSYVAWGKETNFGTAATTIDQWELWQNVNIDLTHNLQPVKGLGARQTQFIATGGTDGTVSGEIALQDMKMLSVLSGFADAVSGTEAPYTHVLTPADAIPSGTVEIGHNGTADVIYKATGFVINSWTLNASVDDIAKISFDAMFQDIDDSDTTAQTPSLKTTNPFAIAEMSLKLNDAALAEVQNASITYTNNLAAVRGLGSALYQTIKPGGIDVTFNFNANMRATTYHDLIQNDTESDIELVLTESASRSITFTMNNARINRWSEAVDIGGGAVNVTLEGIARYDSTAGGSDVNSIYITDKNALSADYDT